VHKKLNLNAQEHKNIRTGRTCHMGTNGHVTWGQTDMSHGDKRTRIAIQEDHAAENNSTGGLAARR